MGRQHNGQMKQDKMTINNLQNTKQKTKDRAMRTSLKIRKVNSCTTYNNSDLNKDDRLKSRSSTGTKEFEDTKGVIRNRIWTAKKTNNDLQNTQHKTKDRGTLTPLKIREVNSCTTSPFFYAV